jgi:RNA polymerase sigma-70 factor (ECF subfamily)
VKNFLQNSAWRAVNVGLFEHVLLMSTTNDDDRHAEFIRLLNAGHRRLLGYLTSLVGNRHDAEDVLQRASVTMWRRFDSFEAGTEFMAWACTVAFYEARNFQRAAARARVRFSDELLEIIAAERAKDVTQTEARHEALDRCLEKLDEAGRKLVEAAYFEESSILQLAEELGRAPQTLYNKLNVIRRKLAECVTERLAGEEGGAA